MSLLSSNIRQAILLLTERFSLQSLEGGAIRLAFCLFAFGIVFSAFGINGFMREHLGWLSPHLLGAAMNLDYTGIIAAERIYDDGTISPYAHHPPLSFYFFNLVTNLGAGYMDKLSIAYLASAGIYALGWFVLFRVLCHLNFDPLAAALSVLLISSSEMFLMYRALLSFDAFSILSGACLLYGLSIFELNGNKLERRAFIVAVLLCSFSVLVSYYAFPILSIYFTVLFAWRFFTGGDWRSIFMGGTIIAIVMALQTGWIVAIHLQSSATDAFGMFYNRVATDAVTNVKPHLKDSAQVWAAHKRQFSRLLPDPTLMKGLLTFIFLSLMAFTIRRYALKKSTHTMPLISYNLQRFPLFSLCVALTGIGLFLFVARYWATNHPFALIYLAAPLALVGAAIFTFALHLPRAVICAALIPITFYSATLFNRERLADIEQANISRGVIELFDHEFPGGYTFSATRQCGSFNLNNGMQKFLFAYPNLWTRRPNQNPAEKRVTIECADPEFGGYLFKTADGKREYIFNPNRAGYSIVREDE